MLVFFFKQKTAYELRISDWSSDVCSSDLGLAVLARLPAELGGKVVVRHGDAPESRDSKKRMAHFGHARRPCLAAFCACLPRKVCADKHLCNVARHCLYLVSSLLPPPHHSGSKKVKRRRRTDAVSPCDLRCDQRAFSAHGALHPRPHQRPELTTSHNPMVPPNPLQEPGAPPT